MPGAQADVPGPLPEGRYLELEHVEAEVEVLAEASLDGKLLQLAVGRGDYPDVEVYLLAAADPGYPVGLNGAQELGLELDGQLADLVEEEGSVVGELEAAGVALAGRCRPRSRRAHARAGHGGWRRS